MEAAGRTLSRATRALGRAWIGLRAAHALLRLQWTDARRGDRAQAIAVAAAVVGVFGLFAVGATQPRQAGRPAALAVTAGKGDRGGSGAAARRPGEGGGHASGGGGSAATTPSGGPAPAAGEGEDASSPAGKRNRDRGVARKKGKKEPQPGATGSSGSTPVVIGVAFRSPSAAAALAAALELDEAPADVAGQAQAVADWINRGGGIGGRLVQLRPAPYDPALAGSFQTACDVFAAGTLRPAAVVGAVEDATAQTGCLAPQGIALVGEGAAPGDSAAFAAAGAHLFTPGSMALDRLAAGHVRILAGAGFLDRNSRVGVVRIDAPAFERADRAALRPALEDAGATVAAQALIPRARTAADAPGLVARLVDGVLRFQSRGIDRVLVLDAGGTIAPLFMREAERYGFRPRYGLNSTMVPASLPGRAPAAQLSGAAGAGFAPLLDVARAGEPRPPAARERCETIYRDAAVALGDRTAAGQFAAIGVCDALLTLRDALRSADGAGAAALSARLEALEDRRPSAVALATRLGPGRHDGAAELRPLRYDEDCRCVNYSGPGVAAR